MTDQPMRPEDPMRHSGARWCDDHDRWECSRNGKRTGGPCHGSAIRGTGLCRMHSGVASSLARSQGEAKLAAWSLLAAGEAESVDPGTAVMRMVTLTAARVEVLGELLRVQVESGDYDGLVGVTAAAGRDGARVETGEQLRGLVRLEAGERERLVRFAKAAHDMGIAERHIELQQAQAEQVVGAVRVGLDALGSELLPGSRDVFLRAFLGALGRGQEQVLVPAVEGAAAPGSEA